MRIAKGKVGFIEPMLALAVTKLPEGPAWTYELKFDGYRALGIKANGKVRLLSRNGKDFTGRFASIAPALEALPDDRRIRAASVRLRLADSPGTTSAIGVAI